MKHSILNSRMTDEQVGLWYIGQVGFIIGSCGRYIAVDPYLSDYVDKNCNRDGVRWERLYQPPIDATELDFIDAVICTHPHCDHTDPWTLQKIAKANEKAVFIVPAPSAKLLEDFGIDSSRILPAYDGKKIDIAGFTLSPIPAAHEELHRDESGSFCELSYIIEAGDIRIFHGGDMCVYDGLAKRIGRTDVAILPINGRDHFRTAKGIIGNTDSAEAILFSGEINADLLIPVHHDLYEVNRVSATVFVDTVCRLSPTQKYHIFSPGERFIYMK